MNIGSLKLKRGPTAHRLKYTPELGELVLDSTTNTLYIGDGITNGGIEVSISELDASKLTGAASIDTSGNAATADKLKTARDITLTGDVTGTGSFTGATNLSINATLAGKGLANGIATLDNAGKVPSDQLPSFVDDVLEFDTVAAFPETGETGKIYVETTGNTSHRWSGTAYVKITSGEVSSVNGKKGVITLAKADVGLDKVDNTPDTSKSVASALKWTTPRTLTFTGGATGTGSIDGSANVSISLTVDLSSCLKTTDPRITGWEAASTNSHAHVNKAVLDATTESFTTALKNKIDDTNIFTAAEKTKLAALTPLTVSRPTQAEYDALSQEEKDRLDVIYIIKGTTNPA